MGSAATRLAWVALVLLGACSSEGAERAEPADSPELTDVSVPPPDTPCEVLGTEIDLDLFVESEADHPPTPTVASALARLSGGLVPLLPVAEPWTARVWLASEEAARVPEVEQLVRSITGLSIVATLWPVDLAEARLAELAPYPQLAGQITIVGGPVVVVAGDDDAVASLTAQVADELGMEHAVATYQEEEDYLDFHRRMLVARLRERQADLDLLEALGGPVAGAAAVLASTAPEDLVDGMPAVRGAMDEVLTFASGSCGLPLFRQASDPVPANPVMWPMMARVPLWGWSADVNAELLPAVTGPNALPPDGDGPDWDALASACATFREGAKELHRWIGSAPEDAEPIAEALTDLASLHQQFADDCTAAAEARNLLLLEVALDTAQAIEQATEEIVELLDEYGGD